MYFLYGCGLFYENVTHLVRLWLYYVRKCHLWSWSWQKILLFVCFGLNYMNYCLILFFGVSESCINCYCLILLVFLFVYLYLFGLNRSLKILFGLFWSPKSLLLPRSEWLMQYSGIKYTAVLQTLTFVGPWSERNGHLVSLFFIKSWGSLWLLVSSYMKRYQCYSRHC